MEDRNGKETNHGQSRAAHRGQEFSLKVGENKKHEAGDVGYQVVLHNFDDLWVLIKR